MQLMRRRHDMLLKKHLASSGLAAMKVAWSVLGNVVSMNDCRLAGTQHLALPSDAEIQRAVT
jgi:hypothetical protein